MANTASSTVQAAKMAPAEAQKGVRRRRAGGGAEISIEVRAMVMWEPRGGEEGPRGA